MILVHVLELLVSALGVDEDRSIKKLTKSTQIHRNLIIQSHKL